MQYSRLFNGTASCEMTPSILTIYCLRGNETLRPFQAVALRGGKLNLALHGRMGRY